MFLKHKTLITAFLAAFLAILVYLPALHNDFVNWDDPQYIYKNTHIQSIDVNFFKWMFTSFYASNWHPLTWLSQAIDYAIWGLNPMGHHLTNIILHGLNTFLVVLIIIRLINFGRDKAPITVENKKFSNNTPLIASAITGLLFGIHPIHVESVAWVSERKDVLYAFFYLLSILFYLRYTSSHPHPNLGTSRFRPPPSRERAIEESLPSPCGRGQRGGGINYILCLLFFILSLISKPMAVTLPVVLIILDFYPLRRLRLKSAFTSQRKVLIEKIPFIVLSLASSVITVMAAQQKAIVPLEIHPLGERLLIAIRAPVFYLFKMLFPFSLAPLYPYPSKISFLTVEYMGSFILVVYITAFCIWSWKRQKVWSVAWAYYGVTLLPVLGLIQVGDQAAADRYTYLPSLGPFLLAGLGTVWVWNKFNIRKHMQKIFTIFIILTVCFLSFLTIKQTKIWRDSLTLWNYELKIFLIERAYNNRGTAYSALGFYAQAILDYEKAIKLNPKYATAFINRGTVYDALGKHQQAIEDYNMAINLDPKAADIYYNRGICYGSLGNYQSAIMDLSLAIILEPEYVEAYNNRGVFYGIIGNYKQSLEDLDSAIKLWPQYAKAYYNRGISYRNIGNYQYAIRDFQTAARLGDKQAQDYLKSKGIGR
jgi:tetratricopeptide (TPR) repeat protein